MDCSSIGHWFESSSRDVLFAWHPVTETPCHPVAPSHGSTSVPKRADVRFPQRARPWVTAAAGNSKKEGKRSVEWVRTIDLRIMSPARSHCATTLLRGLSSSLLRNLRIGLEWREKWKVLHCHGVGHIRRACIHSPTKLR